MIDPETDFPERRFDLGCVVYAQRSGRIDGLRVDAVRFHKGRPIVAFGSVSDVTGAEALARCELRMPSTVQQALPDDQFYVHALVGCAVHTIEGDQVGSVVDVQGGSGAQRLIVRQSEDAPEVEVPLAKAICVDVNVKRKRIVIRPPEGLLELNG